MKCCKEETVVMVLVDLSRTQMYTRAFLRTLKFLGEKIENWVFFFVIKDCN